MNSYNKLLEMRKIAGKAETYGLKEDTLLQMIDSYPELVTAIDDAWQAFSGLRKSSPDLLTLDEPDLVAELQKGYVNFYDKNTVNPYVALAAKGPWIVTAHGAVIHDSGGYGMLGFGHSPDAVIEAMSKKHVMANIMTASFEHRALIEALNAEIGHARSGAHRHPFDRYICLNSGSESVTIGLRIADLNAARLTAPGAKHEGKTIKLLSLKGSFHGRTDRPAQASHSSHETYQKLASFRARKNLAVVEPNDIDSLNRAFADANERGVFFEMMLIEPVMGEGNPGVAMQRKFYDRARELCSEMGTLLLCDSIQAGLRAQGCLSMTDYPGFEDCIPPDMETYSKAVNAGQYPLSILALRENAAELYVRGLYGNTMTTNPRALAVGRSVLNMVDDDLRRNIKERGLEFIEKLNLIHADFKEAVTGVTGTGLLFAIHLNPDGYKVVGTNGVERYLRNRGIGVIHGGKNALRFTPHFRIDSHEVDLIIGHIREALSEGPVFF